MRKLKILIMSLLLLFVIACPVDVESAESDDWVYILTANGDEFYYNNENIIYWPPTYIEELDKTVVTINCEILKKNEISQTKYSQAFSYVIRNDKFLNIIFKKYRVYLYNYTDNKWECFENNTNDNWYPAKSYVRQIALFLYNTHYN